MATDSKIQSRIEILNYVMSFCTVKCFGENSFSLGSRDSSFHGKYFEKQMPEVGSLAVLQSAPITKWYLSWVINVDVENKDRFSCRYLLKSIEDDSLCWWENVSIWYLPKDVCDKYPEWKWTDKQFDFKKRWLRCFSRRNAYMLRPLNPEFLSDNKVKLSIRKRLNLKEEEPKSKIFDNWKKVRLKDMFEFYDEINELHNTLNTKSN